jgi:hypothetical protein
VSRRILTNGMADMTKIIAQFDEFGRSIPPLDVVEPGAAACDVSWTPRHLIEPPVPSADAAHYMFKPPHHHRPGYSPAGSRAPRCSTISNMRAMR